MNNTPPRTASGYVQYAGRAGETHNISVSTLKSTRGYYWSRLKECEPGSLVEVPIRDLDFNGYSLEDLETVVTATKMALDKMIELAREIQ